VTPELEAAIAWHKGGVTRAKTAKSVQHTQALLDALRPYLDHYRREHIGGDFANWSDACGIAPIINRHGVIYGRLDEPKPCTCGLGELLEALYGGK
jgi:hypothetical protein